MDAATLIGIVVGFGAIFGATFLEGGSPASLFNLPALMIVFGGTIGTAFLHFPMQRMLGLPKATARAFLSPRIDPNQMVGVFVEMADKARREGLLSLEEDAQALGDDFMKKGMLLMIDGTDPELLRSILQINISAFEKRHESNYSILEAMGGYAPTMGILGTVMGLISVLSHLSDPGNIGSSIAVAFVATFYGVFSANLMWLPLGGKLKTRSKEEQHMREVILEGILSIQAGDNPRIVQEKLEGFLAPALRGQEYRQK